MLKELGFHKSAATRETLERAAKLIPTRIIKPKQVRTEGAAYAQLLKLTDESHAQHQGILNLYDEAKARSSAYPSKKWLQAADLKEDLHATEDPAKRAKIIAKMRTHKDLYGDEARKNIAIRRMNDFNPEFMPVKSTKNYPINVAHGNHKWIPDDPEANRLARPIVKMHERDELHFAPKYDTKFGREFSHASPSVILREHNNITTIPDGTPGKSGVVTRHSVRQKGEIPALFPQGGFEHGISPRLSRHAIKRITEDYRRRNYPTL